MPLNKIKNPQSIETSFPLASTGSSNFSGGVGLSYITEKTSVITIAPPANATLYILNQGSTVYYTQNTSTNWTLDIRGDASSTLNSLINPGQSLSVSLIVNNGSIAYFQTSLSIDGVAVTPKWLMGSAPAAGNVNSSDIYTFNIIKVNETPTYLVLGSVARFA